MMQLLNPLVRMIGGLICFCSAPTLRSRHIGISYLLTLIGIVLMQGTLCEFIRGVKGVSDKRKRQQNAERATWNALQASGKE